MNVLFVCAHNLARSPMAAAICRELLGGNRRYVVRSVGLASATPRSLTTRDLAWADVVVVMEHCQMDVIRHRWPQHVAKVWVLDVPDDYDPGEPELRAILTPKIEALLQRLPIATSTR